MWEGFLLVLDGGDRLDAGMVYVCVGLKRTDLMQESYLLV